MFRQLSCPDASSGHGSLGDGSAFRPAKNLGKTDIVSMSHRHVRKPISNKKHDSIGCGKHMNLGPELSPLSGHAPRQVGRSNTIMWN